MPNPPTAHLDARSAPVAAPSDEAGLLDGGVPVALLPVRLETRFLDDDTTLAIRIFPQQIHIDTHEPDLTEAEIAVGTAYWETRWTATDQETTAAAWSGLAGTVDPPRARWIVKALTPTNLDQLGSAGVPPELPALVPRPAPWSRTPVARLLPTRWVALGYRDGTEVFRVEGQAVRDDLAVGLSPGSGEPGDGDGAPAPNTLGDLLDDDLRWVVDYGAAVDAGMAITVTDDDLAAGALADGLDQLIVLGVDGSRDPAGSVAELATRLDHHAVTDGLALLGSGTPTNNTEADRAAAGTDPALDPAGNDPAAASGHPAADLLGRALALPATCDLLTAPGTGLVNDAVDAALNRVMWPASFGLMCGNLYWQTVDLAKQEQARTHAEDHLRPSGPYPAVRIGDQPYGVLPVLPGLVPPEAGFLAELSALLDDIRRRLWTTVVTDPVPRLGASDDLEGDLVELLRRTPYSQYFRYRPVIGLYDSDFVAEPDEEDLARYLITDPQALFDLQVSGEQVKYVALVQSAPAPIPAVTFGSLSEVEGSGEGSELDTIATALENQDAGMLLPDPVVEPQTMLGVIIRLGAVTEGLMYGNEAISVFAPRVRELSTVPTAALHRRFMGAFDATSHRLDAWITSVATARLDTVRDTEAGCYLGGYGYVEHLRPGGQPASDGLVHAPSVTHAATAAVLRSGHLARREEDDSPLAIDLGSGRVERGLELMEGVGAGQPVGALLGYRFERGLRDRDLTLTRYTLAFRQVAPLPSSSAGLAADGPTEAVAARDVVDGLELLERWTADRDGLFDEVGVAAGDRPAVDAVLGLLDDTLDAVSDLLLAESVHQTVAGNPERAAAALDALDRQEQLPEPEFVRTPRTAVGYQHRLAVLAGPTGPAGGWEGADDPRRRAEPRLDRWIGAVLGSPDRYRLGGDVVDGDGEVVQTVTATLAEVGLSALSTVLATASPGPGGQGSELEARLALHLGSLVEAPDAAGLALLAGPPAGSAPGALGLHQLMELCAGLVDLVAAARPVDARHLSPDSGEGNPGLDPTELRARADQVAASVADTLELLDGVGPDPDAEVVTALADLGRIEVLTGSPDLVAARTTLDQLRRDLTEMEQGVDRDSAPDQDLIDHDTARIRLVFGDTFPVLPVFRAGPAGLADSAGDPGLLAGDPLAPATWVTRHALVRPPVARFTTVVETAELFVGDGAGLGRLTVAQLPHEPGDRWIGLPWEPPATAPAATTGIVAHLSPGTGWDQPMAGLLIDQWSDAVPRTEETTGLAFHFDAPGARGPQAILLAVPTGAGTGPWTTGALADTVLEAMDLATIRALDLDDLADPKRLLPSVWPYLNYLGFIDFHLPELIELAIARQTGSDTSGETP